MDTRSAAAHFVERVRNLNFLDAENVMPMRDMNAVSFGMLVIAPPLTPGTPKPAAKP